MSQLTRPNFSIADLEASLFKKRRDFHNGHTITDTQTALLWSTESGGDGHYYIWKGTLPKVVPFGSTPNSSGGISESSWFDVKSATLQAYVATQVNTISVEEITAFGGYPEDDWYPAIQYALNRAEELGGATVILGAKTYTVKKPVVILSNTILAGAGQVTKVRNIHNPLSQFPETNCIHIGYSNEWDRDGSGANPSVPDTTLGQLVSRDYSNIRTRNSGVYNLSVVANGKGLGVWAMNAQNIMISDIWSEQTTTPINIANDANGGEMGCDAVIIRNIYQVTGNLGDWYDLLFIGHATRVAATGLFNNPNSKSLLPEMIAINGAIGVSISDFHLTGSESGTVQGGVRGILARSGNVANINICNGEISRMTDGVILDAPSGITVSNLSLHHCYTPIQLNSAGHLVTSNNFENNVIDIAGDANGINNLISNNLGIRSIVSVANSNPWLVNTYKGNRLKSGNLLGNYNTYSALCGRKYKNFPMDSWMSTADVAATNNTGAVISKNATGTFTMYFKIPLTIKKITNLILLGFAGGSGDSFNVSIVGVNDNNNTNALLLFQDLGTLNATAGDFSLSYPASNYMYANGTYYVKVICSIANLSTQFRSLNITALSEE